MEQKENNLKEQILSLVKEYYAETFGQSKEFVPGKTFVNYGGRYFGEE